MPSGESLLKMMMPAAVMLRTLDILKLPEEQRPKPDDMITCLECEGTAMGCPICCDHGKLRRSEAFASFIAYHGDELMYGGKKEGAAAKAFNVLAEGLTMMSFCPGGVEFMGMRFDAAALEARWKGLGKAGAVAIVRKTEPEVEAIEKEDDHA